MRTRRVENKCWQSKTKFIVSNLLVAYISISSCPNEQVASAQSHDLELHALEIKRNKAFKIKWISITKKTV